MRRLLLLVLCLFGWATVLSGSADADIVGEIWAEIFDGGNGNDYWDDVAIDSGGNLIAAGYISSGVPDEDDTAYANKYNPDGTVIWHVEYEVGPMIWVGQSDSWDRYTGVEVDSADNIILSAQIGGHWTGYTMGSYNAAMLLQKYPPDDDTAPTWERIWQDGANSAWQTGHGVVVDGSNNAYVASNAFRAWDNASEGDWATLKYDPDGNIALGPLYYGTYPDHFMSDDSFEVAVDLDGNIIVVGRIGIWGTDGGLTNDWDWHVRKYNSAGTLLWSDTYSGAASLRDEARAVAVDDDGNVYVAGYSNEGTDNTSNADYDWVVIKYAPEGVALVGQRLWTHTFESAPGRNETCSDVVVYDEDSILVGGYERAESDVVHGRLERLDIDDGSLLDEQVWDSTEFRNISSMAVRGDRIALGGYSHNGTDNDMRVALAQEVYDISGTVTLTGGAASVTEVTLTLSGDATDTTSPASDGSYSLAAPIDGNYTVTPSLEGYVFEPIERTYEPLAADAVNQDFTGTAPYEISGTVALVGGPASVTEVTLTLNGDATDTTSPASDGSYSLAAPPDGDYTVTPSLEGYVFEPIGRTYEPLAADAVDQDFAGTALFDISGTVALVGGPDSVTDVTLTLSGDATDTTSPAADGTYSFTNLEDGDYAVTPSLGLYDFDPVSRPYSPLDSDQTGQDFTGTYVPPPVAALSASVTSGIRPLTVDFTNESTGAITSLLWDFGDGYTSTQQDPSHPYYFTGDFTVTLTATGPGGSDSATAVIDVDQGAGARKHIINGVKVFYTTPTCFACYDDLNDTLLVSVWGDEPGVLNVIATPDAPAFWSSRCDIVIDAPDTVFKKIKLKGRLETDLYVCGQVSYVRNFMLKYGHVGGTLHYGESFGLGSGAVDAPKKILIKKGDTTAPVLGMTYPPLRAASALLEDGLGMVDLPAQLKLKPFDAILLDEELDYDEELGYDEDFDADDEDVDDKDAETKAAYTVDIGDIKVTYSEPDCLAYENDTDGTLTIQITDSDGTLKVICGPEAYLHWGDHCDIYIDAPDASVKTMNLKGRLETQLYVCGEVDYVKNFKLKYGCVGDTEFYGEDFGLFQTAPIELPNKILIKWGWMTAPVLGVEP